MTNLPYNTHVVDPAGVHWIIWEAKPDGLALVYELGDGGGRSTSRIAIIETGNLSVITPPSLEQRQAHFGMSTKKYSWFQRTFMELPDS